MIDKEKQIEEMANYIYNGLDKKCHQYEIAEMLYNAGYRKVGKDEIVISKKEYNRLKGVYDTEKELLSQLSKDRDSKG